MSAWQAFKSWRRPLLGTLLVMCGLAAAGVTVVARRRGDWELARLGALSSLVIALAIVVFVVPPLARSARAEAARLDLPFQITAGGAVFLSVYAVVTFAAWNTGNNLLFLVFSLLSSALFVAWAAARASLRDLAVSARFPDHIFAGEPAPVIVTVHNTKRVLPSFSILVEARTRSGVEARRGFVLRRPRQSKRVLSYFMYAPRGSKVEQRVELTFERRGLFLVTGFDLSTRFPFGFFRLRRRLRARDVELFVYPKPEVAGDELHLLPIDAGQMQAARRGAGRDLHSMREYQPHDDVRLIDWKATARQKRLMVREFTAEDERRVHVALDTCGAGAGEDAAERFEHGVTLAASLLTHFVDERAEVRLTLGDEEVPYGSGREHLYACLRCLALVTLQSKPADERRRGEFWERVTPAPRSAGYVILLTAAPPGTIPADLWRRSHVIYL